MKRATGSLVKEVLGITNPQDPNGSLHEAHLTLTGEVLNRAHLGKLALAKAGALPPTEWERYIDMVMVAEIVNKGVLKNASTLADWPSYRSMMQQSGTRANGTAAALMIGSMCSLSSRAFVCLARDEYGAGDAHIIDPVSGAHKARHGKFRQGSGLALPYDTGSIDFVHTNHLLENLADPSALDRPLEQTMPLLFSQIARVLAPGGQLLMKEVTPGAKDKWATDYALDQTYAFATAVTNMLEDSGFGFAQIRQTAVRQGVGFLLDPNQDFSKYPVIGHSAVEIDIYARIS